MIYQPLKPIGRTMQEAIDTLKEQSKQPDYHIDEGYIKRLEHIRDNPPKHDKIKEYIKHSWKWEGNKI